MLGPSDSFRTKSRTILAAVMVATSFFTPAIASAQPQWGKVGTQLLRGTMELMTVATTAKAAERVGEQMQAYWKKTVLPGESAYSVRVSLSRISWADWLSKPDLFLLIDCEGVASIVLPVVFSDYDGSEVVFNFRCPTFPPMP